MLSFAYMYVCAWSIWNISVNARKLNQEVIKDSQCFNLKTKQSKTTEFKKILHEILRNHNFHVIQWIFVTYLNLWEVIERVTKWAMSLLNMNQRGEVKVPLCSHFEKMFIKKNSNAGWNRKNSNARWQSKWSRKKCTGH